MDSSSNLGARRPARSTPACLLLAGLVTLVGCTGGNRVSGDRVGQPNGKFTITPAVATVIAGQVQHFTAASPWGAGAVWTVLPATGGSFDGNGNFTAGEVLGTYQIVAMWQNDVRYTASASLTVVAPPLPPILNPALVQASGGAQATGSGLVRNAPVVGESIPAKSAAIPGGSVTVRHGFEPSVR